MKIWHISDTHGFHNQLIIPDGIDLVVHTGDSTNYYDERNEQEFIDFLEWYASIDIPNKIYVAGNHDGTIYKREKWCKSLFKENNIVYLHDELVTINDVNIYGSPWSPTFGNWYFMQRRDTLNRRWDLIPDETDILLCHTMPMGVLDLTVDFSHFIKQVGCSALFKRTQKLPNLKLFCGGHIHNNKNIINFGLRTIDDVTYSNGSAVKDGRFELGIVNNGTILEI